MQNRKGYLDVLRIVAISAVIMIHVSAAFVTNSNTLIGFTLGNIFDSVSRLGVPLFLMISGALMLDENREFNLKKRILPLFIPLLCWSFLYAFAFFILSPVLKKEAINFVSFIRAFLRGHYHLWYMWAIIGLYLITPILRKFVKKENKKIVIYFIALSIIFSFTKPMITLLFEEINFLHKIEDTYLYILENLNLDFLGGLTTYFLAGWLLSNLTFDKRKKIICYVLGVISLITIIVSTQIFPKQYNLTYSNSNIFVLFYSTAVYTFVKESLMKNKKSNCIIAGLSNLSFGVYLTHIFVLSVVSRILPENPYFIPLIFLITIVISFIVSYTISKMPIIKKTIKA